MGAIFYFRYLLIISQPGDAKFVNKGCCREKNEILYSAFKTYVYWK